MDESPSSLPFESAKPEETIPLLQSAVAHQSKLQCWTPGRKYSYVSRVVKVHETSGLISISVAKESAGGAEFEASLIRESLGEILFSLNLPTDVIFFKGELRKGEAAFFNVRVKEPIFKVQRRIALRLPMPGNPAIELTLSGGKKIRGELVNISEGGAGVILRSAEDFKAISGLKDEMGVAFSLFGISVVAKASLRHESEASSSLMKKTYRLGLFFTQIDPALRAQISQLVFEESAKYLGRY